MKTKNKGFSQLQAVVAPIVGTLLISGVGYFGLSQYKNYQQGKLESEKMFVETRSLITQQQNAIEDAQKEIARLKVSNQAVIQKISSNPDINTKQNDLKDYINHVGWVSCTGKSGGEWSGSGSVWMYNEEYQFLTNYHVIEGAKQCQLLYSIRNTNTNTENQFAIFDLNIDNARYESNSIVDYAIVGLKKISDDTLPKGRQSPLSSSLKPCQKILPLSTPVFVIGFPVTTETTTQTSVGAVESVNLTVTDGVISAYDNRPTSNYPDYNYFVTAKIDSGNSGGLAVAKQQNNFCVMGIPTAVKIGNYETQGMVQSINNIIDTSSLPRFLNSWAKS